MNKINRRRLFWLAVLTIVGLLILFYKLKIGLQFESGKFIFLKDILLLVALTFFLIKIQQNRSNKLIFHLGKSILIAFTALLSFLATGIVLFFKWNLDFETATNEMLSDLPHLIGNILLTGFNFLPIILIASIACYFVLRKPKPSQTGLKII